MFAIIMFVLMIASLWEFLEYTTDIFLKMDVQHNIDTGVNDTMEDMLVAFIGSVIVSINYLLNNNSLVIKIVNKLK